MQTTILKIWQRTPKKFCDDEILSDFEVKAEEDGKLQTKTSPTRQESPMIHLARPTVSPVVD